MRKIVHLFLLCLFALISCKKDGEESKVSAIEVDKTEISVTYTTGKAEIAVRWSYAQWELETAQNGFLTDFTYKKGGSADQSNTTRVSFNYTENNTVEERIQEIIIKNVATGATQVVKVVQATKPPVVLSFNSAVKYQYVTGFGGMLNPALWQGNNQLTTDEIQQLYSMTGLGYNMLRMMIYEDPTQWDRDVAVALKAQSLGARIFASPWTPPRALKSNNSNLHGYLLPAHYAAYAKHLNDFVDFMTARGVTIEAVSIQNEPDWSPEYDGCEWTGEQIRDFIRDHGQAIKVKVIAAEAVNFKKIYTDPTLSDATAVNNLDIIGTHLYGGGITDYPLARQYNKEIWMTEHLMNTNSADDYSWQHAMIFGKEVHDCMEANFNAYVWWYLKRHYSMLGDGEYGSPNGAIQKRGYVMAHYAKYATGRQRIAVGKMSDNNDFLVTAYEGDKDYTIIIQNHGINSIPAVQFDLPVAVNSLEAIETSESQNMREKNVALSLAKNSLVVNVLPMSIISIKLIK